MFGFEFGRCYAIVLYRQMLLPWQMLVPYVLVVDDITTEEDVTSSITGRWQMLLPYDVVVDVEIKQSCMLQHVVWQVLFAKWQMEWPL